MPHNKLDERADFARLVEVLLEEQRCSEQNRRDTRKHDRQPYPCLQMIAPYSGRQLPEASAYRQVRCFDLSPSGFSYVTTKPPEDRSLIIALGTPPRLTYLAAEVAHHTPLTLVGCRFTGRVPQ